MKNFRLFVGCCLTAMVASTTVQAQTLTQDWAVKSGLPAATNARWGVGYKGKIYTNDKSVSKIISIDSEGATELAVTSCNGTAITVDEAGNFIVNSGFPGVASCKTFKILPAGASEMQDLSITLPEGVTANRMDFIGRAVGNVMSADGGAFYITPKGSTKVVKIFVANGAQDADKTKTFDSKSECTNEGIVQPMGTADSDEFISRPARGQQGFSRLVDGADAMFTTVGSPNSTAGGDGVTLNGTLYTIEPCGTNYADGFQIVDRSSDSLVATHDAELTAGSLNQNAISVEKVDEYTAVIYQYVPGAMAAKYTFSLPKPTMYIIGQSEGSAWNPTDGIAMTWKSENVWTATITTTSTTQNLGFSTVLAENNDDGGWSYVNANRYGLSTNDAVGSLAENLTISKNTNAVKLGIGTFFIRINLNDNTLYIAPTKIYVIGNTNIEDGHDWSSTDESYMAESGPETPGVFRINPIDMKVANKAVGDEGADDLSYFALVTCVDSKWGNVNGNRWCPEGKNGEMTDGVEYTDFGRNSDGAFCIKNGAYDLVIDLNAKTIKATYLTPTSVEKVTGKTTRVIAANGTISILGDATSVSVYNVAGQAVAVNTPERTLNVARGMYVVMVDGKAEKVIVR